MSPIEATIKMLTQKLAVDRELQMEVAGELRSHLLQKQAELQASGIATDEAEQQAIHALGDTDALREQLWESNRKRLSKRGIARWAFRIGLVPAAIAMCLLALPTDFRTTVRGLENITGGTNQINAITVLGVATSPALVVEHGVRNPNNTHNDLDPFAQIDPEQQIKWHHSRFDDDAHIHARKKIASITEHDELVLYLPEHLNVLINAYQTNQSGHYPQYAIEAVTREEVLTAIDRGRTIEPTNAYYDLMHAYLLLNEALKFDVFFPVDTDDMQVKDEAKFAAALKHFRIAAEKPELRFYSLSRTEYALSKLPAPQSMADRLRRTSFELRTLLPHLSSSRRTADFLAAHAKALAANGQTEEAIDIASLMPRIATKFSAESSPALIELFVWRTIASTGYESLAEVHELAGNTAQAQFIHEAVQQESLAFEEQINRGESISQAMLRRGRDQLALPPSKEETDERLQWVQQSGLVASAMATMWITEPAHADRRTEYAVTDQAALSTLCLVLLAYLLWCGVRIGLAKLASHGSALPTQVLLDAAQLRRICMIGVCIPMSIYLLYSISPFSAREWGLNVTSERILFEYTLLACSMLTLLRILATHTIMQRARQFGMDVPQPTWKTHRPMIILAGLLGIASVIYFVRWNMNIRYSLNTNRAPWAVQWWGYALMLCTVGLTLLWHMVDFIRAQRINGSLEWSRRFSFDLLVIAALYSAALAGWTMLYPAAPSMFLETYLPFFAILALVTLLGISVYRYYKAPLKTGFALTLTRSIPPAMALPLIVLTVLLSQPLHWVEAHYAEDSSRTFLAEPNYPIVEFTRNGIRELATTIEQE